MDLIFEDNAGKFGKSYCRNYNRTKTAVQDQLAKLYSADQCQLVSSGINAIACVLDCLARTPPPKKGIKLLLVSDEMYCDTIKVVKFANPENAGKLTYQDATKNCYKYKATEVKCPSDPDLILEHPLIIK